MAIDPEVADAINLCWIFVAGIFAFLMQGGGFFVVCLLRMFCCCCSLGGVESIDLRASKRCFEGRKSQLMEEP
jgi:hypothetical protein